MADDWTGYGGAAPLWPNFATNVEIEFEFETQINLSRTGFEQRIAALPYPRIATEFDSWAKLGKFAALWELRQTPNAPLIVPFFYRSVRLGMSALAGDTALILTGAPPSWLQVGTRLVLHGPEQDEAVVVSAVGDDDLTLAVGLSSGWPAGTRAFLARRGYREADKSYQIIKRGMDVAQRARVEFDGSEVFRPRTSARLIHPDPFFGDIEVFDWKLNWGTTPSRGEDPYVEEIVSRRGIRERFAPHDFYGHTREESHTLFSEDEIEQFGDFFVRHRGRQRRFYASNYLPKFDMSVVVYPDDPGPTGLDRSHVTNFDQFYRRYGMFELTGSDGEKQLVNVAGPDAGSRIIPVTFQESLFPDYETFGLIAPEGPSRAHIEAGLVRLIVTVYGRYENGGSGSTAGTAAGGQFDFNINLDHEQTADNADRWDGLVRGDGQYFYFTDESLDQTAGAEDPVFYNGTIEIDVPVDSWFVQFRVNFQKLGTTDDIFEGRVEARLEWDELTGSEVFETLQPITVPLPVTADSYGVYRFDSDRLTISMRTGGAAETKVTLRELSEVR